MVQRTSERGQYRALSCCMSRSLDGCNDSINAGLAGGVEIVVTMVLQIYGDFLSQPSRALLIFARANNIQHEEKIMQVMKKEHKKPEFLAINPMGRLPAMVDDDFNLFESHAIFRYLATTRSVPDHCSKAVGVPRKYILLDLVSGSLAIQYPADPQKRAVVDCILEWHHLNLRAGSMKFLVHKVLGKSLGVKMVKEVMESSQILLIDSLIFIENIWLTGEGPFLAGASQPSIADLSLVCEVVQSELLDTSDREAILGSREKIRKWVKAVEDSLVPHFADVHSIIRMVSIKSQAKRDAQKRQSAL